MNRLLISTALAGLLAASGAAFAQDHRGGGDGHPGGGGPGHAPSHADGPRGGGPGPGAHQDNHRGAPPAAAAPARATPPAPGRADDHHFNGGAGPGNHGPDNRGPDNHDRGNPGARFNGPGNGPGRSAGPRRDFSAFHRNLSASRRFHAPSYHRPSGWYARRWTYGQILPSLFWAPDYWINDYDDYALPVPPPGTVWVRDGDDALLIDRYSGEIIQVDYGVFY